MLEDRLLAWRLKKGSSAAFCRIYEKYYDYLLTVATALLNDINTAEDVVQDSFVKLSESKHLLDPRQSLKWYLVACVSNRARDERKSKRNKALCLDDSVQSSSFNPVSNAICNEQMRLISDALGKLPYEQREVLVLHTRGRMTFKAIAKLNQVSVKTIQSRYRYGLEKMKILLNGQVTL